MAEKQPSLFPDKEPGVGVLTDTEIRDLVSSGLLITRDTYNPSSLEAASYDIRAGAKGILGGVGKLIDLRKDTLELGPGAYGGVLSLERVKLPENVCARIGSKRALSYDGMILLTGAVVDPGYEGHLLFGLYNASQRRVMIRYERKICNVVFERLSTKPDKIAPVDPSLRTGNFPDAFVDRMANMDVLPWLQISERVKQIEQITKDILDLKVRYEDVLKPIRDLTENVRVLTENVGTLTVETKGIATDVGKVNAMITENGKQINQLTANMGVLTGSVHAVEERTRELQQADRTHVESITTLRTTFGRFQILVYIFWGLLLLGAGALLKEIIHRLFSGGTP